MWEDDEDRATSKTRKTGDTTPLRLLIEEALFGQGRPLFDLDTRSLRPLCRVEAKEDAITVTFDLPRVEKKDISLTSSGDALRIEAKMRAPITLRVGGVTQRRVVFERYTGQIRLPSPVDPGGAKATFRNGLLRVKFPIAK